MKASVCTLFEGSYHHGVAALINSLWKQGFSGVIYIGHREKTIPEWLRNFQEYLNCDSEDCGIEVELIFLDTNMHLANYKPTFMRLIFQSHMEIDALFYFDPDICVVKQWSQFLEWVGCGLCLCEDVNSPMSENHPKRMGWRLYYSRYGRDLKYRTSEYYNSGFLGLTRVNLLFLDIWCLAIEEMAHEIGSLSLGLVKKEEYKSVGFSECFINTDQDAMNAALEITNCKISAVGKAGMGFSPGDTWMPHAVGDGKPWERSYFKRALNGQAPRLVDKIFWKSVFGPARSFDKKIIKSTRLAIGICSIIGRFYRST